MWGAAKEHAQNSDGEFPLLDVYSLWQHPPSGVRSGLLPLLAAAFVLAHRPSMAVYVVYLV